MNVYVLSFMKYVYLLMIYIFMNCQSAYNEINMSLKHQNTSILLLDCYNFIELKQPKQSLLNTFFFIPSDCKNCSFSIIETTRIHPFYPSIVTIS